MTTSTTHRLLKTLRHRGFVVVDQTTRRYTLGPAALRLAGVIIQQEAVAVAAIPHLERLRLLTGKTAALHWLVDGSRVCVLEFVSRQLTSMTSGIGRRYPLYAGAGDKCMLAFLAAEEIEDVLYAAATGTLGYPPRRSSQEILQELEEIKESGYARSFGEVDDSASALAAPILDSTGVPRASISLTGPATRWTTERMDASIDVLLSATVAIEPHLGFLPRSAGSGAGQAGDHGALSRPQRVSPDCRYAASQCKIRYSDLLLRHPLSSIQEAE